jgi:membrane-bound ClpP family serine protease
METYLYTQENYLWGMVGYYIGCLLVLLYLWRFRKLIPGRYFRGLFLLLVASILLVPITAYPDGYYLAPAWFVSLFEGFTEATEQGYLRGALPIAMVYLGSVMLYFFGAIYESIFGSRRQVRKSQHSDTEMLTEE